MRDSSLALRMTPFNRNQGFSLLEMVIAIFIIAVVLGFSLIAMGKGMGLSAKSSDLTIATVIAEQEMARVKNIPFPPTTVDRQSGYAKLLPGALAAPYSQDFEVEVIEDPTGIPSGVDKGYNYLFMATPTIDEVMLKKITVNVYRKRDNAKLATLYTYIARNGTI